jgi:oligopeptide transport system substrate-binding protein
LLAEAGYPDGRGLPELCLVQLDPGIGERERAHLQARWVDQWRELGVELRQEWVPEEHVREAAMREGCFLKLAWISDYPDPQGLLRGLPELEWTPLPSERVRALVERAGASQSRDERLKLYREADRRLVAEEVWTVPVDYSSWYVLHRPWVSGLWAHPLGIGPLDDVVIKRDAEGAR